MRCLLTAHDTQESGPVPPQGPSLRQKSRSPQLFCKRLKVFTPRTGTRSLRKCDPAVSARKLAAVDCEACTARPLSSTACSDRNGLPSTDPRRNPGTTGPFVGSRYARAGRSEGKRPPRRALRGESPPPFSPRPDQGIHASNGLSHAAARQRSARPSASPGPRDRASGGPRPYIPAHAAEDGRWKHR